MSLPRLKIIILSIVLFAMPILFLSVERAFTQESIEEERQEERQEERREERREARREARRLQRANKLPNGCSVNARGNMDADNQSSQDEIIENASESGVSEAQIAELNELAEDRDDLVGEVLIQDQTNEEVIFEPAVAQVLVVTPEGAVQCHTSDELTDSLLSEEGITYIGGPLDNQNLGE